MDNCNLHYALVVGKQELKICEVVKILAGYFSTITRIEGWDDRIRSYSNDCFGIIVFTDSLNRKVNENLFGNLRRFFPRTKLIGLFDNLDQDLEISMRCAGMIYLGSYEHFSKHFNDIFQSAFKRKALLKRSD